MLLAIEAADAHAGAGSLRNALLDVRDADVASRPADTIRLNFNPYGLGAHEPGIKGI
jgi:hypothetical protein